jgi:colanic acid/amylovoran biosynthesis glycosyltransferase
MSSKINLAIFSPNANAYSETFIQAHKDLPFSIKFYHDGFVPRQLEGEGFLTSSIFRLYFKLYHRVFKTFSPDELALIKSLKKERINYVLAEFGITGAKTLNLVKYLNLPLMVHFHGADAFKKDTIEKYESTYKSMFFYAKHVIAVSNVMDSQLIKLGCPKEKLTLNVYGPKDEFYEITPNYNSKQFVAIGRFVDKKAPYATILAFKEVLEKHPDAKLIFGGSGPLLNTCQNICSILGLNKSVIFSGILSHADVMSLFSTSLAFVQHSIVADNGDSEGTPVIILEAAAASLPVVSTRHAGIPDVIIENVTGFLVDEMDTNRMAQHMIYLCDHPDEAKKMGIASSNHVKQSFSLEKHLKTLTQLIFEMK